MRRYTRYCLFFFCMLMAPVHSAAAQDILSLSPDKNPVFLLRFFDAGEQFFTDKDDPNENETSTWTLSAEQRNAIVRASNLWAEIIQPAPGIVPALIHVGTMEEDNADAISPTFTDDNGRELPYTVLQAHLWGMNKDAEQTAQIRIGKLNGGEYSQWGTAQLPMGDKPDLQAVMVHEIGHALGITGSYSLNEDQNRYFFGDILNTYTQNLYAVNADGVPTQATPNMAIVGNNNQLPQDGSPYFDVRPDKVYFSGPNVREVLQGALLGNDADLPGIPINNESNGDGFGTNDPDLSHFELINGQMSHQEYRNYTAWMEAELAVLQDMGYVIDRKNFFGTSIYNSGVTKTVTQGFFGRNSAGTAYVDGSYNSATLGLGLHIYGSHNVITQQGDILTRGEAGAGVRVDGTGNTVTIPRGTTVRADGVHGTGLMVAYGSNHTVNLQGDMQALGSGGIGARFDFGNNMIGNDSGYRGSYITLAAGGIADVVLPELEGPLVNAFNIGGRLAGSGAALYISRNAWVKDINVLSGASLEGAIVSDWDDRADFVQLPSGFTTLHTGLNFGVYSNGTPDTAFAMRYDGVISGKTLNMRHAGGALSYNGAAAVNTVNVLENARLSGNAQYTVANGFSNAGIVAPGNSLGLIRVIGDYTQLPTGTLHMEFDGTGQHDVLSVSGSMVMAAGASAVLMPAPGFFAAPVQLDLTRMIQSSSNAALSGLQVGFQSFSPTLHMAFSQTGNTLDIATSRAPEAYSQYATTGNARQVGLVLPAVAQNARNDMQRLFASLDFAPVNTIDEALNQLSPAAYSSIAQAAVDASAAQSALVVHRMLNSGTREQATEERLWTGFVVPFGSMAHQENRQDMVGYSVNSVGGLTGVERWFDNGIMAGMHTVFEHSELNTRTDARNKSDSFAFGVHALVKPEVWSGAYLYGLTRAGVTSNKLYRDIEFANYQRKTKSDWTGYQVSATFGGGYDWRAGNWTFGPVLDMNYDMVTRPGLTESQGEAARLRVESDQYHAVHSKAGFRAAISAPVGNAQVSADMSAGWKHFWSNAPRTRATFAGYSELFSTETSGWGRDSLHVQAALHAAWDNNVFVRGQIESDLLRAGYSAVQGSLSVGFSF